MRIENLSIRFVTVMIFFMIGVVAIVLSLFAGSYFRQAALDSQINSLSRVIEVAAGETVKAMRGYAFDLGMRLGNSPEVVQSVNDLRQGRSSAQLVAVLDDPFINGFVGFSNVSLEKIRVYDVNFVLLAESNQGMRGLEPEMPDYLRGLVQHRRGVDRLKSVDALWLSANGPLNSTLVPIGGLRLAGYLEIVVNPAFNLPDIGNITKTPVNVFDMHGQRLDRKQQQISEGSLPVEYIMPASDGRPAFRIVGYEDVAELYREMTATQLVTTSGFLLLTLMTLLFALWLFNRFLFVPLRRMMTDMAYMAQGKLDLAVNKTGLRDFAVLAQAFDAMAAQIKRRTNDLERLLDLDDSAILCFGRDNGAVYMNSSACTLLGYSRGELADLELADVFVEDINRLMQPSVTGAVQNVHPRLHCYHKDGSLLDVNAVITALDVMGGEGFAIVLNPPETAHSHAATGEQHEQRVNAIEQSLSSLLEIARNNPGLIAGLANVEQIRSVSGEQEKTQIRQQAVSVMTAALACWQHDIGKSKLSLAEESRIWPVYIDKSTPTTRTLDKYLNIDSCPKNPRCQRVIETAEFVLRKCRDQDTLYRQRLQDALESFRSLIAGA